MLFDLLKNRDIFVGTNGDRPIAKGAFFWENSMLFSVCLPIAQLVEAENFSEEMFADLTGWTIFKVILTLVFTFGGIKLIQVLTNFISERVPRRFRLLVKQSVPFWKGFILILAVNYLSSLLINFSEVNLIALTGTIAVTLGFAFKDYISSIIAGIVALFEAPYRVGDRVQIGDDYGEVVGYGLRSIQIQTPNDNLVTIPHNKIWTETISSANSGNLEAMVVTHFYFDPNVDVEQVIGILYQAAYSSRYTQLKLPVTAIVVEEQWSTHFKLKSYPMDARDEFVYQTDLVRRAKKAFARQGLPYARPMATATEDGKNSSADSPIPQ